jgi:hypothetical protein
MAQITYTDKEEIIAKGVHINQWWDDDANEVKAAVNDNDTRITSVEKSSTATGTATFTTIAGTWINTPSSPASSIVVSSAGAVNGGIAAVYYSGAVLTAGSISGGSVVLFSGTNVLNELCLVFIIYDKTNNVYSVNIQVGATGGIGISFTAPTITVTDGISFTAPTITVTDGSSFTAPVITVT